jgi:hypothetical protein
MFIFIIFSYYRVRQWWPKLGESLRPKSSPTGSRTFHRQIFAHILRVHAHFTGKFLLTYYGFTHISQANFYSHLTGSRTFNRQTFTHISRLYAHFLSIVLLKIFFLEISISRVFWRSLFSDLISDGFFVYLFVGLECVGHSFAYGVETS